jgi:SPP1 gp7 family putative phage head morphogenesis protein
VARWISPETRRDPTRTLKLLERTEAKASKITRAFYVEAEEVIRNPDRMHAGLSAGVMSTVMSRIGDLSVSMMHSLDELAEAGTNEGYLAGDRFGAVMLGADINERREAWGKIGVLVEAHKGEFAGMSADMTSGIRRVVSDGILNERTQGDMIAEIRRLSDATAARAETIVRTEVMRATNAGITARYEDAGVQVVEWVTVVDGRECSRCQDLDGMRFEISDAPPRPLHPRCRCTIIPVIGKAEGVKRWSDVSGEEVKAPAFDPDAVPLTYDECWDAASAERERLKADGIGDVRDNRKICSESCDELAVDNYVGSGYRPMNRSMRDGVPDPEYIEDIQRMTAVIDRSPPIPRGTTLYRGCGYRPGKRLLAAKPGDVWEDAAFQSFSHSPHVAHTFASMCGPDGEKIMLRFIADGSVRGAYIESSEFEFVVQSGTRWKILSIDRGKDKNANILFYTIARAA